MAILTIGGKAVTIGGLPDYEGFVMADYLPEATPDYSDVLIVHPDESIPSEPQANQEILFTDSNTPVVITHSPVRYFVVTLVWEKVSHLESRIIMDYFLDPLKANGFGRTFPWQHPTDGNVYVVRFLAQPTHKSLPVIYASVDSVNLLIEGVYNG